MEFVSEKRRVYCRDAIEWINSLDYLDGSVITSLPDVSEMQRLTLDSWKEWFTKAAEAIFSKLKDKEVAIFYQSDIKILESDSGKGSRCKEWVDKAFLIQIAAQKYNVPLLWHKIYLIGDMKALKFSRSNYSHMICFSKTSFPVEKLTTVDVDSRGSVAWKKGMGITAGLVAVEFAKAMGSKVIIDPFCGKGTTLAIANHVQLDAIGVDIKISVCRKAHSLTMNDINEK